MAGIADYFGEAEAVQYYPTLELFEATTIIVGRGTDTPFEVIGYPAPDLYINYEFQIEDDPQLGHNKVNMYGEKATVSPHRKTPNSP
ncbi:DUF1343 domain-containing protein [Vibrio sp. Isolate23]|uniref:exo-beta-N-acetylmuramidase NamZ domain-containing protein n=1 Tax=Vibrio sp. Isolate23 TaxID=2908533 RepID=UPI001EFD8774|nr:exo-beta-N-acetylmuramidase NamZ domain-containing protein [Vibrio sp. Isolate23]MCG9681767.1 DUF1343 domain-containing protein [Vibrio sp. Isolate23]